MRKSEGDVLVADGVLSVRKERSRGAVVSLDIEHLFTHLSTRPFTQHMCPHWLLPSALRTLWPWR